MVDLFSYIEHAFAVPSQTHSIDVENQSDFQKAAAAAAAGADAYTGVRLQATAFLERTVPTPTQDALGHPSSYLAFRAALLALSPVTTAAVRQLATHTFGSAPGALVRSAPFLADKERLENVVLAVKIVTAFDKVNARDVVRQLQMVAFLEALAAGQPPDLTADVVGQLMARSVEVPSAFLVKPPAPPPPPPPDVSQGPSVDQLRAQRDALRATYSSLMALHPDQMEVATVAAGRQAAAPAVGRADQVTAGGGGGATREILRIAGAALERLPDEQRRVINSLPLDRDRAGITQVVDAVRRQWVAANQAVLPYDAPTPAKVYSVGGQVFAVTTQPLMSPGPPQPVPPLLAPEPAARPPSAPDFSKAITRPVGFGNLHVVRQELIGYEAGEISHIENVLEGELLKRSTHREEVNELILTEETTTTQSQERDQQSTDHNELATQTQKESGQQTTTSGDQTTSSDYGKLVENSKTNYAKTVTSKAVNSLTQMVRRQRIQRETKTYVEDALHELDNTTSAHKVRGIYQWVDKKYSVRVLNYGKRLLFDVVVPEPAAFLIQSLKDAVQPETFQLTKPTVPGLQPGDLDTSNYAYYAALYAVSGSVSPPPEDFVQTVTHQEPIAVEKELNTFGQKVHGSYYGAFTIRVPDNYKAVGGYIQRVNPWFLLPAPDRAFEFFIGDRTFFRFGPNDQLNQWFTMNDETGDVPVTLCSFPEITQFNFAIAINCKRTDQAYEKWQLQTHAAIMAGYQRQLADYQDKLTRYTAAVRAQMAMAGNFAHDPSIEQQELKKAFIYLLLGEHPSAILPTPDPAPVPPWALPPDPKQVRQWGAMVAFFERAFEWDNIMYTFYPYFWGHPSRWEETILIQDVDPQFEAFLKAGAARVVIPARPGFEAALAHFQETGDVWMGEEMPDMFSDYYVSIIAEIKAANYAPGAEVCVDQWEVMLPTTLVLLKDDAVLPSWPKTPCVPPPGP